MPNTPAPAYGLPVGGTLDVVSPYLNPSTVVAMTAQLFGARAITLAAWYAFEARQSRRDGDYRLWLTVFKHHQYLAQHTS